MTNGDKLADYGFPFKLPGYDIDLITGGGDVDVTVDNCQDYVDLVLHYTFHETIKMQVQAFKKGFNSIFPIHSLAPFTHSCSADDELIEMVCGMVCKDKDFTNEDNLKHYINPDHGYDR